MNYVKLADSLEKLEVGMSTVIPISQCKSVGSEMNGVLTCVSEYRQAGQNTKEFEVFYCPPQEGKHLELRNTTVFLLSENSKQTFIRVCRTR